MLLRRAVSFFAQNSLSCSPSCSPLSVEGRFLSLSSAAAHFSTSSSASTVRDSSSVYDVVIVGGGVTGTALLYTLSAFTDARRIGLCERRGDFGVVASYGTNNSQTIHCGDIETNYSLQKAASVKRHADVLRNFACKLAPTVRDRCVYKMPKMALAVGSEECDFIRERFGEFRKIFGNMQLIDKQKIAEVEPRIAMLNTYTFRPEALSAIYIPNEHTAVDYYNLTAAFVEQAKQTHQAKPHSKMDLRLNTEVSSIEVDPSGLYRLQTSHGGVMQSRYVAVSACGGSLLLAHRLGYGLNFSCLPIAGSFYFSERVLAGKVYTVQNPLLPFAAVHGDPDVVAAGKTRFGPTALPLPMLERYNSKTVKDFLEVLRPDLSLMAVYWDLFKVSTIRNYIMKNFLFEIPKICNEVFVKEVQKIIPSMKPEDLVYAKGFGGVRPQLVDKRKRKLLLGEGRIAPPDANIVFNITPSPGATTCLGTAEMDARKICTALGLTFNQKHFEERLLKGPYPVDYVF